MNKINLNNITNVLDAMIQFELSLSELYEACAGVSKEDEALWRDLSQAEIYHANNIRKMMAILTAKYDRFETGRPFNLTALNTVVMGVKDMTRRVSQGKVSREKMLIMARDFEQSVLESYYAEIVKTTDVEYQALMKNILSQTQEHKKALQKAIDDAKTKGLKAIRRHCKPSMPTPFNAPRRSMRKAMYFLSLKILPCCGAMTSISSPPMTRIA